MKHPRTGEPAPKRRAELESIIHAWNLDASEAAAVLGIDPEVLDEWHQGGIPAGEVTRLVDLFAAAELLRQRVSNDRLPEVVRRSSEVLGGRSLLELAREQRYRVVLDAVRSMFDLRRTQP